MRFFVVSQVGLFFGAGLSTAEYSWLDCGLCVRHCRASMFGGHTCHTSSFWPYCRAFLQSCIYGRMLSYLRNLACLFSSIRFTIAFGRVTTHFSVAKLVCSRARLKSFGQWRSLTNLPLSCQWFWRLALTKIKSIWLLSLSQPYSALTYVGSVKIILITT